MPELVMTNALVYLSSSTSLTSTAGATDVSDHVMKVVLTRKFDVQDDTHMGQTAHSRVQSLEDVSATVDFLQDFASTAGGVNQTIDKLLASMSNSGASRCYLAMRPVNAARTSDNPEYSMPVILQSYDPINGSVGDLLKTSVPFMSAGTLSRLTSSS